MINEKELNEKRRYRRRKGYIILIHALSVSALTLGTIALFYVITNPKLEKTVTIIKDGQKIENLEVGDMPIIPGEKVSYQLTMYNRMMDDYFILVNYEGDENLSIYNYITTSINSNNCSFELGLTEIVNKGYQCIGKESLSKDVGVDFTVSYYFSDDLTEDLIEPFSLKLSFKISHYDF